MNIPNYNPESIDWNQESSESVVGAEGEALVKTRNMGDLKIRQVEYSANYMADHWCEKGHVVHVIGGELELIHIDGAVHFLTTGMTYIVGDNSQPHQARSSGGAKVLIID
jgi:hypothetical protein